MIEYLYDAIVLIGDDELTATITDEQGQPIKQGCTMTLYNNDEVIQHIVGTFNNDTNIWHFPIENNYKGRMFYTIELAETPIAFKQPIYFK